MSFRLPPGASALVTLLTLTFVALISAAAAAHSPKAAALAEVSDTEVEEWSRYVELAEGSPSRLSRARKVEEIVILRTLAGRLDARLAGRPDAGQEPSTAAELDRREEQLAAELAGRRLEQRLGELETPSEAAVRADFAARRESLRHPRLWRLSDIFKTVPRTASQAERDAAREEMGGLRARLVAGESFADLARAESDSSTRERGGAAGFVALDDLHPELARVVAALQPGDPLRSSSCRAASCCCSAAASTPSVRRISMRSGQESSSGCAANACASAGRQSKPRSQPGFHPRPAWRAAPGSMPKLDDSAGRRTPTIASSPTGSGSPCVPKWLPTSRSPSGSPNRPQRRSPPPGRLRAPAGSSRANATCAL